MFFCTTYLTIFQTIILQTTSLIVAYLLDRALGDPNRLHPIIGFGNLIAWGERKLNKGKGRKLKGILFHAILITIIGFVGYGLSMVPHIVYQLSNSLPLYILATLVIHVVTIFYMISGTTLIREVKAVFNALDESLEAGRTQVGRIVGRDTAQLSVHEVQTAALETLSENLSDGVVAPLFWYTLLGIPGILIYKMINTQDSMVGYKNERYVDYGYFSAKIDDVVNYLPARLTALLMLAVVSRLDLLPFVSQFGKQHASPNSGYPEAALAGVLGCRFGGPHDYFGQTVYKPYIGEQDRELTTNDTTLAIIINRRVEIAMLALSIIVQVLIGL